MVMEKETNLTAKKLMKITEGKRPITGSGYALLVTKFMMKDVKRTDKNTVAGSGATALFG